MHALFSTIRIVSFLEGCGFKKLIGWIFNIALISIAFSAYADIPHRAVIAHRGASYYAPESTAPAYIFARDLGVDYLELDLQRTKDGRLIAFHDDTLERTTNVKKLYPNRIKNPINEFTLSELKRLDVGSWFNRAHPDRARRTYVGLKILTLDEIIDISEIASKKRPGLYIETKNAKLFPGIEKDLKYTLKKRGWYDKNGRVILQTFEKNSLILLNKHFKNFPIVFLVWLGEGYMEDVADYKEWINFAFKNGAVGIGPNHINLLEVQHVEMIKAKGMFIHTYTVNSEEKFAALDKRIGEKRGFFTDRPEILLGFYGRSFTPLSVIARKAGY